MNTFYDQFQRCMRHPHQRIVGICSICLHERLTCLVEPIYPLPPTHARKGSNVHSRGLSSHEHESIEPSSHASLPKIVTDATVAPGSNADVHTQRKAAIRTQTGSASSMAAQSNGDARNSQIQAVAQQVCHSDDFASAACYFNRNNDNHTDAREVRVEVRPLQARHGHGGEVVRPVQAQNGYLGDASASASASGKGDALGKKKMGWFSPSKAKASLRTSSMEVDERKSSKSALDFPRHTRAGTSQAVGSSSDAHRHVRMSDLEAIAEANAGDTSKNHITREAGASTSWISSLFHRRKGPRSRSSLSNSSCRGIAKMDAGTSCSLGYSETNRHSPKSSIDAGRLSWDGARPNFKQLLKRVEARNSKQQQQQQRPDLSPLQFVDYAMKEYNDYGRGASVNQTPHLQKSKSVASARSSISLEMPKDLMHSSFTPMIQPQSRNLMAGLDYDSQSDDRNLRRSRSWGRTWNRALSPLWGSRSHRYKGIAQESPSSAQQSGFHAGPVTPSHVSKGAATPSSSSHLSPLRRSKLAAPQARIQLTPHGKIPCNATQ